MHSSKNKKIIRRRTVHFLRFGFPVIQIIIHKLNIYIIRCCSVSTHPFSLQASTVITDTLRIFAMEYVFPPDPAPASGTGTNENSSDEISFEYERNISTVAADMETEEPATGTGLLKKSLGVFDRFIKPVPLSEHHNESDEHTQSQQSQSQSQSQHSETDSVVRPHYMRRPLTISREISDYQAECDCMDRTPEKIMSFKVLDWWQQNRPKFPNLFLVAMFILSIPASSASSERSFSLAGQIFNSKRTRMSPELLSNAVVLNSNYDLIENLQ